MLPYLVLLNTLDYWSTLTVLVHVKVLLHCWKNTKDDCTHKNKNIFFLSFYKLGVVNLTVCSVELSSLLFPLYLQVKSCVMNYAVPEIGEVPCAAQFFFLLIVSNNDGPQPKDVANLKTEWKTVASAVWVKSISTVQKGQRLKNSPLTF